MEVDGYLYRYSPNHNNATKMGYVCEHRLVMEKSIGRLLDRKEAVHHINGDKRDNRLENLELCKSNGSYTIEHHNPPRDKFGRFITGWGSKLV